MIQMRSCFKRVTVVLLLLSLILASGCTSQVREYQDISHVEYHFRSETDELSYYYYLLTDNGDGTCELQYFDSDYTEHHYEVPDTYMSEIRTLLRNANALHWNDMTKYMTSWDGVDIGIAIDSGSQQTYIGSYWMPEDMGEETLSGVHRLLIQAQENCLTEYSTP